MTNRPETKVALITGAASGIGLAITVYFLSQKVNVIAVDADPDVASKISAAVKEPQSSDLSSRVEAVTADVTDWDQQCTAVEQGIKRFGRLDYVVPCAGIGERPWLPFEEATPASEGQDGQEAGFKKPDLSVIDVDLTAVLYTVALGLQQFRRQGADASGQRGHIILISSICGIYAIPGFPIYTAAKHALVGFTRSYALPLQRSGILLNAIGPAVVRTNISISQFYDKLEASKSMTPMTTILEAVERAIGGQDGPGVLYECGPGGVTPRAIDETQASDSQMQELCTLLQERAEASSGVAPQ